MQREINYVVGSYDFSDLEFVDVDYWCRFVFQSKRTKRYYCSVEFLCEYSVPIEDQIEGFFGALVLGHDHLHTIEGVDGEPGFPVRLKQFEVKDE